MHYILLLSAWFIFALWGIISREVTLPIPILLTIITFFGFVVTFFFKKNITTFSFNKTAFIVSIFLVLDLLFLFIGFRYINFATVITLHYFAPVIVTLLSPFILDEKISNKDILLSIVGFIGISILFFHELQIEYTINSIIGLISAFLSSFTLAGNILYQRLYMKQQQDYVLAVRQYNFYMFIIYLLLIVPIWFISDYTINYEYFSSSLTIKNIILAILAGAFVQGIAMILFNSSARFISAKNIAKLSYTEILWVVLFGFLIYNETLNLIQSIGIFLVLIVNYTGINNEKK